MTPGDRVAWYRYDDHLDELHRYGEVIEASDPDTGLTLVRWDDGSEIRVFTSYLEPEAEVRRFFAEVRS